MKFLSTSTLANSLSLLPKETPKKLVLLVLLQIIISALDILAILLLGMTCKLGLDYVQNESVKFPEILTSVLRIDNFNFEIQVGIMSLLIVILFSTRTAFSIYSNNRIFLYLAKQASYASKQIVEMMFRGKPQSVIARNSQEFLYGITIGIDNLTLNFLGSVTIFTIEIS